MALEPLREKWRSFGWSDYEIDGHDMTQVVDALEEARMVKGKPTVIVAQTVKGKGVSFMEDKPEWHGKAPSPEQTEAALREIKEGIAS